MPIVMKGRATLLYMPRAKMLKCTKCDATIFVEGQEPGAIDLFSVEHAHRENDGVEKRNAP
jgi:hypothetical protein